MLYDGLIVLIIILAIVLVILATIVVITNIRYKKKLLDMSMYQINTSAQIDGSIPEILSLVIDECFNDYKVKELLSIENEYINSEKEAEIRRGLTDIVTHRISNATLDKLSLFYNITDIAEILADKIYITVMNFAIAHNNQFNDK